MCRWLSLLAAVCCTAMIGSAQAVQSTLGSCNYGCSKNRLTSMDPNSALVREAQVQAIKIKILKHLGLRQAPNITMSTERRRRILDLLSAEMGSEFEEAQAKAADELKFEEENKSTAVFADEDMSCPPGADENAVICLKFQVSREIQNRPIATAEVGFSFSAGRNRSFQLKEWRKDVPSGHNEASFEGLANGGWIRFDITNLSQQWTRESGLVQRRQPATRVLQVICKSCSYFTEADALRLLDVEQSRPFMMLKMDHARIKRRSRRSVDCDLKNETPGCCRYPFEVDFHQIGWDWIILPKSYKPNFCRGTCNLEVNLQRQHTVVMSAYMKHYPTQAKKIELSMCCAGVKMSSLNIAYSVDGKNVHQSTLDNMIVDECHCA